MGKLSFWNNLSVKHKMLVLVLVPIALIIYLATRQISSLNQQLANLEKVEGLVRFTEVLSNTQQSANDARLSGEPADISAEIEMLRAYADLIYTSDDSSSISNLLDDYRDSVLAISEASTSDEIREQVEWQVEAFSQLLFLIEKAPFSTVLPKVDGHMLALMQLEWLMFWADEEIWQVRLLLQGLTEEALSAQMGREAIIGLAQNQQLFVERFIAINADAQQVSLLLKAFSEPAFEQSTLFRAQLLEPKGLNTISPSDIRVGLDGLSVRLNLIQGVSQAIEGQLRSEIIDYVHEFEQQRTLFLTIVTTLTMLVLAVGASLAHRVTRNLGLVLDFLEREDSNHQFQLSSRVKGNDELSRFAQEVERLTRERQESQKRLIEAKNDAERAKENAIQASKAKSSFLANMSHEIRTPLNGVIGISEVLSDTALTATQKDYVDTIETSSQLLLSLINDILDFSKIESGMLQINPHSTSIRETMYDIAAIIAPKVKEKGVELNVDIDESVPYRVQVDDHRLRQILMNFMSNAVKFTDKGCVTIGVHYLGQIDSLASLQFEVQDSGIGIDKDRQSTIFEAFAQEDDSTTRQFGGTGLGLAISTQLIELMGGEIQLDSVKGLGSRFYFNLALEVDEKHYQQRGKLHQNEIVMVCSSKVYEERIKRDLTFYGLSAIKVVPCLQAAISEYGNKQVLIVVESGGRNQGSELLSYSQLNVGENAICLIRQFDSPNQDFGNNISALLTYPLLGNRLLKALEACSKSLEVGALSMSRSVDASSQKLRVLLVEDNPVNQKVASLYLKKIGCEFDIVQNGKEALEWFCSGNQYSFVLMDCMMPVMDGFEATKAIRTFESETSQPRTPIIALTASVVDDDIQKCFDSGMDDYVPKPFKAEVLKDKIAAVVEMKDAFLQPSKVSTVRASEINEDELKRPVGHHRKRDNTPDSSNGRVLLVEDNLVNQKVASLHLEKAGFEFVIAGDGKEAVDVYERDSGFDVILMDCMMPIMDGFHATKAIRAIEDAQGLKPTPIIALTASVVDDDIQKCFEAGMDAYVPKPVRREKLLHEMKHYLS
ncbi:response regulator [Vibrio mediterranei]|uniref:response regulator n=1 Tax=Vibrio mediterranei TaxID=689 RepID=UPI004068D542